MKRKRSAMTAQHAPSPLAARHASEPASCGSDQIGVDHPPLDEPEAGVRDRGAQDGGRDRVRAIAKHRRAPDRRREASDRRHAPRPPRRRIAALYAFIASDRLTLTTRYTAIASAIASIACPVWLSVVLVIEIRSG